MEILWNHQNFMGKVGKVMFMTIYQFHFTHVIDPMLMNTEKSLRYPGGHPADATDKTHGCLMTAGGCGELC